jgi:hypothetical protein
MHVHPAFVHSPQPFFGTQEAPPKFIPHRSGLGTLEDALHKMLRGARANQHLVCLGQGRSGEDLFSRDHTQPSLTACAGQL